jgi:hypothetical protein
VDETEWRWDPGTRQWELVKVGDISTPSVAANVAVEGASATGSLGCLAVTAMGIAIGWLVRKLRRRR